MGRATAVQVMDWYVGPVYPEDGGASHWVEADTGIGAIEAWLRLCYSAGYEWSGCAISAWPSLGWDAWHEDKPGGVMTPRNSLAVMAIIETLRRE
jgi:hypothetical protein